MTIEKAKAKQGRERARRRNNSPPVLGASLTVSRRDQHRPTRRTLFRVRSQARQREAGAASVQGRRANARNHRAARIWPPIDSGIPRLATCFSQDHQRGQALSRCGFFQLPGIRPVDRSRRFRRQRFERIRASHQTAQNTEGIESTSSEKSNKTRKISYSLIITSGLITEGTSGKGRLQTIALHVYPLNIESMRHDHFIILNCPVIADLPPLSTTLYKRLYLHFSNLYQNKHDATSLSFEKDYAAICAEWFGGLKTMSYKAEIIRQLKPHLDALKHSGLIRSVEIVRRTKGDGFKIVFIDSQRPRAHRTDRLRRMPPVHRLYTRGSQNDQISDENIARHAAISRYVGSKQGTTRERAHQGTRARDRGTQQGAQRHIRHH